MIALYLLLGGRTQRKEFRVYGLVFRYLLLGGRTQRHSPSKDPSCPVMAVVGDKDLCLYSSLVESCYIVAVVRVIIPAEVWNTCQARLHLSLHSFISRVYSLVEGIQHKAPCAQIFACVGLYVWRLGHCE